MANQRFRLDAQPAAAADSGFATGLCAHASTDGILANAGHLPPYRNSEKLPFDSGLPLDITADTAYAESMLRLVPNDRLIFLSDGVVEAESPTGELSRGGPRSEP